MTSILRAPIFGQMTSRMDNFLFFGRKYRANCGVIYRNCFRYKLRAKLRANNKRASVMCVGECVYVSKMNEVNPDCRFIITQFIKSCSQLAPFASVRSAAFRFLLTGLLIWCRFGRIFHGKCWFCEIGRWFIFAHSQSSVWLNKKAEAPIGSCCQFDSHAFRKRLASIKFVRYCWPREKKNAEINAESCSIICSKLWVDLNTFNFDDW